MEKKMLFVGTLVIASDLHKLDIVSGYLIVEGGVILRIGTIEEYQKLAAQNAFREFQTFKMRPDQFLMPGFVDCHTHGPQFPNLGLGLDLPLLEWLEKYTFPLEMLFSCPRYASGVYSQVVRRLLHNGTTTACYFGSLHLRGTIELVKCVANFKQRALIGKVSMNIENSWGYFNTTDKELEETKLFVESVLAFKNPDNLVSPVITPRFAVSCDSDLMKQLGDLAAKHDCHIQSHISENVEEIKEVLRLNPDCKSYAEVYDKCGLLTKKCIMAHAVHLTDEEIALLRERGVGIAHCPASNTRLRSGLCPVRKLLENNLKVGLGTDVSGGDSPSILDAMRRTMDVSTHLELLGGQHRAIDWKEALYLATLGGARALNLDHKTGSLQMGKEFDALLIDMSGPNSPVDKVKDSLNRTPQEAQECMVQRFVYTGDDRNISKVYVKGYLIKSP